MADRRVGLVERIDLSAAPVSQADFPVLDRVGDRIARGLNAALAASGGAMRLERGPTRTTTLRDWKAGLPPEVAVAQFRDPALKGGLLLSVPRSIIAACVDSYYGGEGSVDPAPSTFGAAEQRLFDRLAHAAREVIATGWSEVASLAPTLAAVLYAAGDVAMGKPDDAVVVQQFSCGERSDDGDRIVLVYPLAALRSVAGLHAGGTGSVAAGGDAAPDPVWQRRLCDAVMQSRLPVRTVIARPSVPLGRLMALAPGDFIPVTLPARVPLTVAGRLLAHGTIGEANGRAAIMIDRIEPGALDD